MWFLSFLDIIFKAHQLAFDPFHFAQTVQTSDSQRQRHSISLFINSFLTNKARKQKENNFFFGTYKWKSKLNLVRDMRDIIISSTTKRNKCVFCWQEKWIFSYRPHTHESLCWLITMMMMTKNTLFAVFCLSRSTWTWSSCDTVYHKQTHLTFNTLLNEDNSLLCVLAASWQGIFFSRQSST